ncbi:hypothetical protein [Pseudaminobacter soli (ex Li et al. 2025)]|uniref:hypothetical protein n=1 Tax=Pseudaminobacter soli (ex Li et al. 2025) TaxID=1295366 RepID=UPI000D104FBA|nr:hypothetical protein [Mesorhizobium soli]
MPSSHEYLSPSDLGKIKRVLAEARFPMSSSRTREEAARFLMRKFQEGMTEEAQLADALEHYIEQRAGWRILPGGDLGKQRAPER